MASNTGSKVDEKKLFIQVAELTEYVVTENQLSNIFRKTLKIITSVLPTQYALVAELRPSGERVLFNVNSNGDGIDTLIRPELPASIFSVIMEDFTSLNPKNNEHDTLLKSIFDDSAIAQGLSVVIQGLQRPIGVLLVCPDSQSDITKQFKLFMKSLASILGYVLNNKRIQQKSQLELLSIESAKADLEQIIDTLPEVICLLNQEGRIIRTNNAIEKWGVCRVGDVKGKTIHEIIHPNCRDKQCDFLVSWETAWSSDRSEVTEWEMEEKQLGKNLKISIRRLFNNEDRWQNQESTVVIIGELSQFHFSEDISIHASKQVINFDKNPNNSSRITNRIDTQEFTSPAGLIKNLDIAQQQDVLLDNNIVGIYISYQGTVIYCNKQFASLLNYESTDELYLKKVADFFVNHNSGSGFQKNSGSHHGLHDVQAIRFDGDYIWLHCNEIEFWSDERLLRLGYVVDISQQKAMADIILKSQKELHALSRQLLNAQEDERKRLASELHDGIGQHLSAAKMEVEISLKLAGKSSEEETKKRLKMAISRIKDTIEEVRNLSMDLRPSTLDDLGLLITVAWFCRQFQSAYPHINIDLDKNQCEERNIPDGLKVVIYRIIQEALNNIAKHAHATEIFIRILKTPESKLQLFIKDNGVGFDVDTVPVVAGERVKFGLKSMRERVESTGGKFIIISNNGDGTAIKAQWVTEN